MEVGRPLVVRRLISVSIIVLVLFAAGVHSFYLPGVAPQDFANGDELRVKVNKLTSTKTQLPYTYYSLPYCKPDKIVDSTENLGEVLRGDRIENSPFEGQETESARYISKPYFENHLILDDLRFDNFVRDEISLSSCVDKETDVPKLTSLQRNLIGEGSHRRLSSVIRLEVDFSKSFCEIVITEKLPSGVFADPFELHHLVQRSVFSDAAVFGDTNLELPSFRSNRSLVEIHMELNLDNLSAKNKQVEVKIQLPLHARYPPLGKGFATIKFRNPSIFLCGCSKEGSGSDQNCVVEPLADYSSKSESVNIEWKVPCGSKEHAGIVSFVTFMSAIVSTFLIVLAMNQNNSDQLAFFQTM